MYFAIKNKLENLRYLVLILVSLLPESSKIIHSLKL